MYKCTVFYSIIVIIFLGGKKETRILKNLESQINKQIELQTQTINSTPNYLIVFFHIF